MNDSYSAKDLPVYIPHGAVSSRTIIWSLMTGLGIALPAVCLCSLIAPEMRTAADMAVCRSRLTIVPGMLTLRALLVAPILEELFFRGLLLQMLGRYLPLWAAVSVPALLFAIMDVSDHNNGTRVGFPFLAGLYFSWLVVQTRSLWPPIICNSSIKLMVGFVLTPIDLTTPAGWLNPLKLTLLAGSLVTFMVGVRIIPG